MSDRAEERSEDNLGLDRIIFFTDAVIAIAATLLVIGIGVPDLAPDDVTASLASEVLDMWPQYLGFAVSFWVIAKYWVAHHRVFRFIDDYDARLIAINTLFLMCIAFMPFTTSLLFTYPAQLISVLAYAGLTAAIGLSLFWLWAHASRGHHLVGDTVTPSTIRSIGLGLLVAPMAFLTSMAIALFDPLWAMYSWIVLLPLYSWLSGRVGGLR